MKTLNASIIDGTALYLLLLIFLVLARLLEFNNIQFEFNKDGVDLFAFGDAIDIMKDLQGKGTSKFFCTSLKNGNIMQKYLL